MKREPTRRATQVEGGSRGKKSSRYEQVEDGQWWLFHEAQSNRRCKIACCDCGLVHQFRIRMRGGKVAMRCNAAKLKAIEAAQPASGG